MIATVYRLQDLGSSEAVATARSGATGAVLAGEVALFDLVVIDPTDLTHRLTPADGDAWIAALPYNIRGGYVRAVLTEGVNPYATARPTRA